MLSRQLKITFVVGILPMVCAIVLHFVLRLYRAPTDEEIDILSQFFATFASTILTFFIGALLFDYQVEKTDAKRCQQLKLLLVTELSETLEVLDSANAVEVPLPDGTSTEVVPAHVQPVILEQAIRDGFFDPPHAEAAARLTSKMRGYGAKTANLFSILSIKHPTLHAIREIEETRRAIVEDARSLRERL